jgi:hypothetical protein
MECWSIGVLKEKDGVREYWSAGVMVNAKKQKQGISETAGLDGCRRVL